AWRTRPPEWRSASWGWRPCRPPRCWRRTIRGMISWGSLGEGDCCEPTLKHRSFAPSALKQILRAFGAQDDRLARSAKKKEGKDESATRRVILSERAVRARSEGSVVSRRARHSPVSTWSVF